MKQRSGGPVPEAMLGFRRIDAVRLVVTDDHVRAEVLGVTHRLPRTLTVSLRLAQRLIARGVPVVVRHLEPDRSAGDGSSRRSHPAGGGRRFGRAHLHRPAARATGSGWRAGDAWVSAP